MANIIGPYMPGKYCRVTVAEGDTLYVPLLGSFCELVFRSPTAQVTAVEVFRIPSASLTDPAAAQKIAMLPGEVEDPALQIAYLQSINPDSVPLGLACRPLHDFYAIKPVGADLVVTWTIWRPRIDLPHFRP